MVWRRNDLVPAGQPRLLWADRLAFFVFTACTLVLAFTACQQEPISGSGPADPTLTGMDADYQIYGMETYLTTEGVRSGQVRADTAFFYEDSVQWRMLGVRMTVYDGQGRDQATIVADSGTRNDATQQMVARGSVVVELPNSSCHIEGSELFYDPVGEQIRSDKPAQFRQGDRTLSTAGFTSDLKFENFSFRSPVGPVNICARSAPVP